MGEELLTFLGHGNGVHSVSFSPDATRIVTGGANGAIKVRDASTGKELRILSGHKFQVRSVVFTPDGKRIVSGGYDATVRIWDATTGRTDVAQASLLRRV